jgi:hypothetical protein
MSHDASIVRREKLLNYGIERREFKKIDVQAFTRIPLYSYEGVSIYSRFVRDQAVSTILPC